MPASRCISLAATAIFCSASDFARATGATLMPGAIDRRPRRHDDAAVSTATSSAPTMPSTSAIATWSRNPRRQRRLLRLPLSRAPLDRRVAAPKKPCCDGAQAGIDPRRQAAGGRRRRSARRRCADDPRSHASAGAACQRRRRQARERLVLADWHDRGHYLEVDAAACALERDARRMTPELFSGGWFSALASIIVIDLILAGDNALVIGLAARNVPREHAAARSSCGAPPARSSCVRC